MIKEKEENSHFKQRKGEQMPNAGNTFQKKGKETFQKAKQNKRRRQDKKKMKGKQEHEKKYLRESLESPSRSADRVSNMTERVLTSRTNWDKSRRERINEIFGNYKLFLSSISIDKDDIRTK